MDPSSELLHAFEVFDPRGHNAVSADALVTHLVESGVPPEEIESILRAAGPTKHGNIHYVRLVRALQRLQIGDGAALFQGGVPTRRCVASE